MELEEQLSRFIFGKLLEDELDPGLDPLAADAVDSLGLEQLVEYIEREFGVTITSEQMVREHFGSVPALAALVESKLAAGRAEV